MFILDPLPLLPKLLHNLLHVYSVPNDDRVGDQVEAAHLIAKLFIGLPPHYPLVGVIKVRSQTMLYLYIIHVYPKRGVGDNIQNSDTQNTTQTLFGQ
jgi:hypothetical protein